MVLVATGALVWACGGDDDSHGSNDSESTSSTADSGGTAGDGGTGGTGGTAPNTSSGGSGGTGGDVGSGGATTATGGGGGGTSTSTTSPDTGGTAGGAGAAGMAGMAGAAGAPGELTAEDIEALCAADCAHLSGVGCPDFDEDYCVESLCMPFYIPGCEAEYAEYLECDSAGDTSDTNEYFCIDDATPSPAYSCSDLFGAVLACTP